MSTKTQKKTIEGKQVGQNIILIIEKKKFSKKVPKKEDRTKILSLVEAYNKRNSKAKEKEIINFMQKEDAKKTAEKKATKAKKNTKAPQPKKATQAQLDAAKKLLEENGHTVAKKVGKTPRPRETSRRREY